MRKKRCKIRIVIGGDMLLGIMLLNCININSLKE